MADKKPIRARRSKARQEEDRAGPHPLMTSTRSSDRTANVSGDIALGAMAMPFTSSLGILLGPAGAGAGLVGPYAAGPLARALGRLVGNEEHGGGLITPGGKYGEFARTGKYGGIHQGMDAPLLQVEDIADFKERTKKKKRKKK
jgi:hypothetical protein